MIAFFKSKEFYKYQYKSEDEFENDVVNNSKLFFGNRSIYIDAKRKITSKTLGNTIPDGFLFDMKDEDNPEFYIVESELYKHDFYSHIFPQITKYFAFFKNYESRRELVEKIYSIIENDKELKKQTQNLIKNKELYKYLSDAVENSQNILLIIDEEKKELPEIMNTYTDTWGKMVKLQTIRKFINEDDNIFLMDPEFETIEYSLVRDISDVDKQELEISEEFHLENVSLNVKDIYDTLKNEFLKINPELIFNPQKYYISVINIRNVIFYKIRKKKVRLIVMLPEDVVREKLHFHPVKSLSAGVQNFYNGKCCAIDIENYDNLEEIVNIVKPLIKKEDVNYE